MKITKLTVFGGSVLSASCVARLNSAILSCFGVNVWGPPGIGATSSRNSGKGKNRETQLGSDECAILYTLEKDCEPERVDEGTKSGATSGSKVAEG